MKRFSEPVFIVLLFWVVSSLICSARTGNILSGRDLLRVVRERDGHSTKPAYAKRVAKSTEPIVSNNQSQKSVKSANEKFLKTALTDYTKDTKYTRTESSLVHNVRSKYDNTLTQADTAIRKSSAETTNLSALTRETPFEEAIRIFRNAADPPLKIVVLWRDLEENAYIDRTTPINTDPVSGVGLATVLKLLLKSVSVDVELGYVVWNGVIIIATEESLPKKFETKVYNVSALLAPPANYHSSGGSPNMRSRFQGHGGDGGYGRYRGYSGFESVR